MGTTLIRGGHIVSMDAAIGDVPGGDVLIDGTTIAAVGQQIDVPADRVIDAEGMLVIPGLIDAHVHLWHTPLRGAAAGFWGFQEYLDYIVFRLRPHEIYAGSHVGALEYLANGVTTVFDFCHCSMSREHADAAIRGIREAGIRAVWAYSASGSQGPDERHRARMQTPRASTRITSPRPAIYSRWASH